MEWLVSYVEGDTMIVEGIGVCLFFGLVYRSVSTLPNWLSETLTSRKKTQVDVAEWVDVNLIAGVCCPGK